MNCDMETKQATRQPNHGCPLRTRIGIALGSSGRQTMTGGIVVSCSRLLPIHTACEMWRLDEVDDVVGTMLRCNPRLQFLDLD